MIDPDDSSPPADDASGPVDPWAAGGSMSTGWTSNHPRPTRRHPRISIDAETRTAFGGRWLPGVVAVGLIATIVGAVVLQRDGTGDGTGGDARIGDEQTEGSVATDDDAAVPAGADLGGTGLPDRRTDAGSEPVDTSLGNPVIVGSDPAGDATGGQRESTTLRAAAPIETVVDIAPELDRIAPVEIVALHSDRGLVELSLPSGRLRTTDTGPLPLQPGLAVTDFGALLWPAPVGAFEVIAVDGSRFVDKSGAIATVATTAGLDRFYVWPDPQAGNGPPGVRSVSSSGRAAPGVPLDFGGADDVIATIDSSGAFLATDAGGTYRIDESGIGRLTTGDVVAAGRNHVLVRECDEARRCQMSTIDANGLRTSFSVGLPFDTRPVVADGLSPTGDALLMFARRTDPEIPPELLLLDLVDGSRRSVRSTLNFDGTAAWANDGSGVFFADVQLYFFDRFTGTTTVVSDDLPKVHAVHTRRPAQTPTCELLSIALARFDEMRAAADGSISPPSNDVLVKILDVAPPQLAAGAEPLVSYIGAFVTSGQPESQRIENLPIAIQEGLATLEDYADTEC